MYLNQMFITNTELKEVGVTKEQIAKLFHRKYITSLHTTKKTRSGIWVQFWQEPTDENEYDAEFAESYY